MGRHKQRRAYPNLRAFFDAPEAPAQGVFAARVPISQSFLSEIVSGKSQPSLHAAIRIAALAHVPIESLAVDEQKSVGAKS